MQASKQARQQAHSGLSNTQDSINSNAWPPHLKQHATEVLRVRRKQRLQQQLPRSHTPSLQQLAKLC
jgi:hypothetical protein